MNATTATATHDYKVGDQVHWCGYSDIYPGTVVAVTKTTVMVRRDRFYLTNKSDLEFAEGGFAGVVVNQHDQRNAIREDLGGGVHKFTVKRMPKALRDYNNADGYRVVAAGTDWRTGPRLGHGWRAFHDYNF